MDKIECFNKKSLINSTPEFNLLYSHDYKIHFGVKEVESEQILTRCWSRDEKFSHVF